MVDDANESLTLEPGKHVGPGTIGIIHCGVTRRELIAPGGGPRGIDAGQEVLFAGARIRARRAGRAYTFTRVA